MSLRVAVVGAGWAGLAAAVRTVQAGHQVTVFEMSAGPGGRARAVRHQGEVLDNGQHILIGAYTRTLALMREVGCDPEALLMRCPLALADPHGRGFAMQAGPLWLRLPQAVLAQRAWPLGARLSLLAHALRWALARFDAPQAMSVQTLCRSLASEPMQELVEPLCVAALNTPAPAASASVFLRVLRDALLSGTGSSDLLLPRRPLSELLPEPAWAWLAAKGADLRTRQRAAELVQPSAPGAPWRVDGQAFDRVVLACSAQEAARLTRAVAPQWSAQAAAFAYEPIVTVYLECEDPRARPTQPMTRLPAGPAQFAFDLESLGGPPGRMAFVISAAADWVDRGMPETEQAVVAQLRTQWGLADEARVRVIASLCERRATFACRPGLSRPATSVSPGLLAAGDYVAGLYPATLEGAVRSGEAAALALALR